MKAGAVLALLLAWLAPLSAIYQDQVGEWDWHQQNVGRPKGALFEVRLPSKSAEYLLVCLLLCACLFIQMCGRMTMLGMRDVMRCDAMLLLGVQGKSMLVWTDEGVLAAVNVRTGALNWRLVLPTGNKRCMPLVDHCE